ncbi:MAG: hypothetical protein ACOC0Z_07275 [Halohasta sp.]
MIPTHLYRQFRTRLRGSECDPEPLDDCEERRTIGDCVDTEWLAARLGDHWRVERDIVRFSGEGLAEAIRLTHRRDGYRITLKPVELRAPTEAVEIYTRLSPATVRRRRDTVDSLEEAIEVARRIADDYDGGIDRQPMDRHAPGRLSTLRDP